MGKEITENTIVTLLEIIMDYVYIWGLEVPIGDALKEIAKRQEEDHVYSFHISVDGTGLGRICSVAGKNIYFDEDECIPDVETVSKLLFKNGTQGFRIVED